MGIKKKKKMNLKRKAKKGNHCQVCAWIRGKYIKVCMSIGMGGGCKDRYAYKRQQHSIDREQGERKNGENRLRTLRGM